MKAFRIVYLCVLIIASFKASAQSAYTFLENNAGYFLQKHVHQLNVYHHTAVWPILMADSTKKKLFDEQQALGDKFFKEQYINPSAKLNFMVLPLGGFNVEKYQGINDTSVSDLSGGFMAVVNYKNKLTFSGDFLGTKGTISPFLIQRFDSLEVMPGFGLRYNGTPGKMYYENWNASVSFSPNKFINVQVGKGKNFLGYGYRSLFLSDNATSYPFAKFTTTFWRIKYISMVAQLKDIRGANAVPANYFNKYATFHLLSWNITKRLNINIFESVVWQAKDTLQNRQLDINYLNPVIFFRPVEYSLGSSDNSILGLGAQFKLNNEMSIYGQGLLDEFLLAQIKADSGWWANKYGLQIGFKAFEPFKLKGFYFQTEYNAIRPFTYSHGSVYQNYAHFNQPLSHPMGANCRDWVTIVQYRYKWLTVSNRTVIGNYGTDTSGLNFGGNLFQSYKTRAQEYHNFIGQGLNNNLFYNKIGVELLLLKQNNLKVELAYTLRKLSNSKQTQTTNFISLCISANLYNRYNDY
ncbi:MAG TPA: hypothetical protein VK177_17515 [Flavobacteriales bacterium]|nr:hypothetical protein [Flavobacteriales bacterium]